MRGQFHQDQQGAAHLEDPHQPLQQAAGMWENYSVLHSPTLAARATPVDASDEQSFVYLDSAEDEDEARAQI